MRRSAPYADRGDAGARLADVLVGLGLSHPLVLAIPRGGIEVGAPIAAALGGELDVVLARKVRAPSQPELALGAVGEDGRLHLNEYGQELYAQMPEVIERARDCELVEIERRREIFRAARPAVEIAGRDVVVVDDGMATGSTLIAALHAVRAARPSRIVVALPVMPFARQGEIRGLCDGLACLIATDDFFAVGQFYRDFGEVSDSRVVELLRRDALSRPA